MRELAVGLIALLAVQAGEFPKLVVPDVPDLTIKTRRTTESPDSSVETEIIYLKGARQRRERIIEWPAQLRTANRPGRTRLHSSITQCDERRTVMLNDDTKTYAYLPIEEVSDHFRPFRRAVRRLSQPETTTGPVVTITIDVVDTGERRRIGAYAARRVITTRTTEPGSGSSARESVVEQDGWYIDLPGADCWDWGEQPGPMLVAYGHGAGSSERVQIHHRGTARLGYPIEEINRSRSGPHAFTTKLELIEFSVRPLDDALFTVPDGYRRALPRISGGYDLTKPDTLVNRLESYWQGLTDWTNHLFR